jgi:hypothetical protein
MEDLIECPECGGAGILQCRNPECGEELRPVAIPAVLPPGELTREQLIQALGPCPSCQGNTHRGDYPGADFLDCPLCDGSGTDEYWSCAICKTEYNADDSLPFNVGQPGVDPDSLSCDTPECVRECLDIDPACLADPEEREWFESRHAAALETCVGREAF